MANHKQALKRHRQSEARQERNRSYKRFMKSTIKQAEAVAAEGTPEEVEAALRTAIAVVAKTASKNVIPRKRAARKISRLTKALQKK